MNKCLQPQTIMFAWKQTQKGVEEIIESDKE